MDFDQLYELALGATNPRQLTAMASCGLVGAAILTDQGNVYTGINIDTACSLGFCAEHSAAALMIANGESCITKVIAVNSDGVVLPPCGRCREFLGQLDDRNIEADIMVAKGEVKKLREILPFDWQFRW